MQFARKCVHTYSTCANNVPISMGFSSIVRVWDDFMFLSCLLKLSSGCNK